MVDKKAQAFGNAGRGSANAEELLRSIKYKTTEYLLADSVAEFIARRRLALESGGMPPAKGGESTSRRG